MHNQIDISIVIPTYKEVLRLPKTLKELLNWLDDYILNYEIIIVDDNSNDGTETIIEKLCKENHKREIIFIKQPKRLGKGAAVKRGCLEAKGKYILFMDADHSVSIKELPNFISIINEGYDMVSGIRLFKPNSNKFRRLIGIIQLFLVNLFIFENWVQDSQCGFKLFTNHSVKKIFPKLHIKGGMIDTEIFYLWNKFKLKYFCPPVYYENKPGSVLNIFKCILTDPFDLIRIKLNDYFGLYK